MKYEKVKRPSMIYRSLNQGVEPEQRFNVIKMTAVQGSPASSFLYLLQSTPKGEWWRRQRQGVGER